MKIGNYEAENVTSLYDCDYFYILPLLSIKRKFCYLWVINIGWLCKEWIFEITNTKFTKREE